jgi:hypothetical protein
MKKALLLILLVTGNCIMESCCDKTECFELALVGVKNFNLKENVEMTSLDTVKANDYAILIDSRTVDVTCFIDFSLGGSLYAFTCERDYILTDEVTNISIKSNADLSANFKAGSELKDLFTPVELNADCLRTNGTHDCLTDYLTVEGISTLEDAFNNIMAVNFYVEEKKYIAVSLLNLFSMKTEESILENTHQITVTVDFRSGETVDLQTAAVVLK